jgi:hypothetical protein
VYGTPATTVLFPLMDNVGAGVAAEAVPAEGAPLIFERILK